MGITCDRGRYYFVMRVPKRFLGLVTGKDGQPVTQVRQALHTDSRREALDKARQVKAATLAQWDAMAAGDDAEAYRHYKAARQIARAYGFTYRPVGDLAKAEIEEIVHRILASGTTDGQPRAKEVTDAILGMVPEAAPTLMQVFEEYAELTRLDRAEKSEQQARRWENARRFAIETFNTILAEDARFGDAPLPVSEITRAHALAYREHMQKRIEAGEITPGAANKHIGMLSRIVKEWILLNDLPLANPFAGLSLKVRKSPPAPGFSAEWIEGKLLAPGAFDGLNAEAADILLVMVNTGLRPSEITDAPLEDLQVDAPIPFIRVAANGRELKQVHTARDVPLLGVSLAAAKRIAARGGITRYPHKASTWSAAVNKFLLTHGLKETARHTPYSLRHAFEDALQRATPDDRIRADIMGHRYARPRYGSGGGLAARRDVIAKIAYPERSEDLAA